MTKFSKFLPAIALAVSLAPFAAQARSDGTNHAAPQHLVRIADQHTAAQGRIAANGTVPANVAPAGNAEYASSADGASS